MIGLVGKHRQGFGRHGEFNQLGNEGVLLDVVGRLRFDALPFVKCPVDEPVT